MNEVQICQMIALSAPSEYARCIETVSSTKICDLDIIKNMANNTDSYGVKQLFSAYMFTSLFLVSEQKIYVYALQQNYSTNTVRFKALIQKNQTFL